VFQSNLALRNVTDIR